MIQLEWLVINYVDALMDTLSLVLIACTYVFKYWNRHICHHVPLHSVFRFIYGMKNHKSVRTLAALSTDKGN